MNKEYFFISKPRCASTFLYEGLTNWNDNINGDKLYYHVTAHDMLIHFGNKYTNSYSFSVIRNPYDLIESWYYEHKKERYEQEIKDFYSLSFDDWVNKGCPTHWNHFKFNPLHQYKWLYHNNKCLVKYIIKLENIENDITIVINNINKYLPKNININTILKTRKNESNKISHISNDSKEKIYKLFQKDFEIFNYDK